MIPARSAYFVKKGIRYAVILFIILSLNFIMPRIMPGDPVMNILGQDMIEMSKEDIEEAYIHFGLHEPELRQYLIYLKNTVRFDFGRSFSTSKKVSEMIAVSLRGTLLLLLPGIILSSLLALSLGAFLGYREGTVREKIITVGALFIYGMPAFLLSMLAIYFFSYRLGWFPIGHLATGGKEGFARILDMMWHLTLPVFTVAVFGCVGKMMVVKASVTQILDEMFIFAARARGLGGRKVLFRHVVPAVLPPFVSMTALSFGFMVSGSLITEMVFSLRGMGTLLRQALLQHDYMVMQAALLVLTLCVLAFNIIADVLYGLIDPRVEDSRK
jgi:peptide/nickel transport system permease protein